MSDESLSRQRCRSFRGGATSSSLWLGRGAYAAAYWPRSNLGPGAFLLANTGAERLHSQHRLLGTVGLTGAYELPGGGAMALASSIFNAATGVNAAPTDSRHCGLRRRNTDEHRLGPQRAMAMACISYRAFTGLGAPHWNADARRTLSGKHAGDDGGAPRPVPGL